MVSSAPSVSLPATKEQIAAVSRDAVRSLIDGLHFNEFSASRDLKLESRVVERIRSWGADMLDLLRPYIPAATILTITCYAHIDDIDIKVQIVLFSSLVIAMDDPSVLSTPSVRDFHRRLCLGAAQDDSGVVGRLLEVLLGMWEFYPDFSSTSIFTSVSQFVNGCLLEQISGDSQLAGSSDAMPFIAYRRNMSGLAEAFAYFIWDKKRFPHVEAYMQAIPDICWYQNHANDVLSFYKEELAGETGNYMSDRARASGKSVQDTLQDVVDETIITVERIRNILGEGPVRDAWESFASGWIAFHTHSPRYRLKELVDCEYIIIDGIGQQPPRPHDQRVLGVTSEALEKAVIQPRIAEEVY
ncbi:Trichodiene synthase-domain-containing protein [Fomitopsis betulina]|nr:Trichodiene synthase-domain-containing protein [Fomitopsis betulina]